MLNLKTGDLVIGLHTEGITTNRVAGKILRIQTEPVKKYIVLGKEHWRPDVNISTSGELEEKEVQVTDQGACRIILQLFDEGTRLVRAGDIRFRERAAELNAIIDSEKAMVARSRGDDESIETNL